MELSDLVQRFSDTPQHQRKAIFSQLMIAATRLQTVFDQEIPQVTLKQFMLLTIVRQSDSELTLTEAGKLLGCSRQNVKKLAEALERKGWVSVHPSEADSRASLIEPTPALEAYFTSMGVLFQARLEMLFGAFSEAETEQFFKLFVKLTAGIDALEGERR